MSKYFRETVFLGDKMNRKTEKMIERHGYYVAVMLLILVAALSAAKSDEGRTAGSEMQQQGAAVCGSRDINGAVVLQARSACQQPLQ